MHAAISRLFPVRKSNKSTPLWNTNISSFFYFPLNTIIDLRALFLQRYDFINRHGLGSNMAGLSTEFAWFYRQLPCITANLLLYFSAKRPAQLKFPDSI